ncbi:rho guanine nucleotide exchange factor 33-like [Arapaima gigas]
MMDSPKPKGQDKSIEEMIVQIAQLQAKAAELKAGLAGTMQDLATLQEKDLLLEEWISTYQNDMDGKILDIRNCLSIFKEDLSATLSQMDELNSRQREMRKCLELLQIQMANRLPLSQPRGGTKEDSSENGYKGFSSQNIFSIIQNYFASLPDEFSQLSRASTQTSVSENDVDYTGEAIMKTPIWTEGTKRVEEKSIYNRQNQSAAMELLESERVYVSYLSFLLKANIAFNRKEATHIKDQNPFPSSLRFLIQEHLKLLHTLQERLLKCQWQSIVGDVFLKLASKETGFLDHYATYLKELPKCLSAIDAYSCSAREVAGLFEEDVSGGHPSFYTLLLQPVRRIPAYLLLLQNLLEQTDEEHPDYYLLLISIEQFKVFTSKFDSVLQRSEELLLRGGMEVKREEASQSLRSKQKQMEQMHTRCFENWEVESPQHGLRTPCLTPGEKTKHNRPVERSPQDPQELLRGPSPLLPFKRVASSSTTDELFLTGDEANQESLCEDEDSAHAILDLDDCSTTSSNSSIDIAFLYWHGDRTPQACGTGQSRFLSPTRTSLEQYGPLQAVQRKSRSLSGLQLDSSAMETSSSWGQNHHDLLHAKLGRQYSAGTPGCKVRSARPLQKLGAESFTEKVEIWREQSYLESSCSTFSSKAQPMLLNAQDQDDPSWTGEPKWRKTEGKNSPVSFGQRSRKQEQKGGFRSSFKKLFKKKASGEKKAKEELESSLIHV